MITNSIAEMRTYGEGFVIVDQSPNAIDISAIRNTNTKILMRLPDENDRQQAGKSAAMTEKQIPELARLPKGVAVVYQNNWLDPVLCKINKAGIMEHPYRYRPEEAGGMNRDARRMIVMMLVGNRMDEYLDISTELIRNNIEDLNLPSESIIVILDAIEKLENGGVPSILEEESFEKLSDVVCELVKYDGFKNVIMSMDEVNGLQEQIHNHLASILGELSVELELAITQCVMRKMVKEDRGKASLYAKWRQYAVARRKEGC